MAQVDTQNLQTASRYINNLLLSRGLLRDGKPIEFAKPSSAEGGGRATMARVINLVHDLILRRDRETETLSSVAQSMMTMRAAASQQTQTISRLETRSAELENQLGLVTAQERAAQAATRNVENRGKMLREDIGRLKLTVCQIRAQCANDVRKRDAEIKRLQKHLEVRRGRDGGGQVGVTVVNPGVTKPKNIFVEATPAKLIESPNYSLKAETTEFLTQLSQSLSDENDALICLVQNTLETLRSLQGLPESADNLIGSRPESENSLDATDPNVSVSTPPSYDKLTAEMNVVLTHLRTLLTSPSFVPLEELELRENEIGRLREGWERMETRWREAIELMNGWRRRILESGDVIGLNDVTTGLKLGEETIPAPVLPRGDEEDSGLASVDERVDELVQENDIVLPGVVEEKEEEEERRELAHPDRRDSRPFSKPIGRSLGEGLFPVPNILVPSSGNVKRRRSPSPAPSPTPKQRKDGSLLRANSPRIAALMEALDDTDDIALLDYAATYDLEKENRSSAQEQPELSIREKLDRAQREADQVAARAAEVVSTAVAAMHDENAPEIGGASKKPIKRTAIPRKNKSKRRSTLSPEELEGLMGI